MQNDDLRNIAIDNFDYQLPEERIAKFPVEQRDHSKLLSLIGDRISEHVFYELPQLVPEGSLLVFNDTRVIHARLFFQKTTGSHIEIFCLEPYMMPVVQAFEQHEHCSWKCLIGNNKKWKYGTTMDRVLNIGDKEVTLTVTRRDSEGNAWHVDFDWTGGISFAELIQHAGVIPLPPYLNREAVKSDNKRYQTVYATHDGSVAAPTAGLHFTDQVFEGLKQRGIDTEYVTLHVGAGTFMPVSSKTIGEHNMHSEHIYVTLENLKKIADKRYCEVIAVGTTSVRTLESLYWFGVKLKHNPQLAEMQIEQWEPYTLDDGGLSFHDSFALIVDRMQRNHLEHLEGTTQLMIAPGYKYRVIRGLVTNFHQPKSTLLLLVSALIGDNWKNVYHYALDHGFRFLSYGDSCLFLPDY